MIHSRVVTNQLKNLLITLSTPRACWSFGHASLFAMLQATERSKTLRSIAIRYEASLSFLPGPLEQSCQYFMVQILVSKAPKPRITTFVVTMGDPGSAKVTKRIELRRITGKAVKNTASWIKWLLYNRRVPEDVQTMKTALHEANLL